MTLQRQVPEKAVPKLQPPGKTRPQRWELSGDHFPWILGSLWTLLLTCVSRSPLPAVIIGCIEIAFYVYNTMMAEKANRPMVPEKMSRDLIELWDNCLIHSPDGPKEFVEGWFYDAPLATLTKQDLQEFLAWGSCSTTWDLLTESSKEELSHVYELFEHRLAFSFPDRLPSQEPVPCMRFSIEPFEYKHKPTMYYWVCHFLLGLAGKSALMSNGFSRHRSRALDYWIRMPESVEARKRTPIVFVHGIGVGLVMYLKLVKELMTNDCPGMPVDLNLACCLVYYLCKWICTSCITTRWWRSS